jgi:hypothetical protein
VLSVLICADWRPVGRCLVGDVRVGVGEAQAAPGVGDNDAVAGVVGGVADLDGEVGAYATDVFGEGGDVLGALVGDAGDAVVVDDDVGGGDGVRRLRGGVWTAGFIDHGVHYGAVGDAAGGGEEIAAFALEFFGAGPFALEDVGGYADRSNGADAQGGDGPRGTEGEREMRCNQRKHRALPKSIVQSRRIAAKRCCRSNGLLGDGGRGADTDFIFGVF